MAKISNRNARDFVQSGVPFKANNLFAEIFKNSYVVYSYGYHFPIFVYHKEHLKWYENSQNYSVTTAKHKSQCRPVSETIKLDTNKLKEIIYT